MTEPTARCNICSKEFTGRDAGIHIRLTGHNDWEMLLLENRVKLEVEPIAEVKIE